MEFSRHDGEDSLFFSTLLEQWVKIFNKVVGGMKNIFKKGNKITLLKWTFSRKNFSRLIKNEVEQLSVQAFYFFKFLDDFGKYKNVQDKIRVFTLDDTLNSDYCGPFQLYFCYNLFETFESSIVAHKKSSRLDQKGGGSWGDIFRRIGLIKSKLLFA